MRFRLPRTACLLRLIALCILLSHSAAYFGSADFLFTSARHISCLPLSLILGVGHRKITMQSLAKLRTRNCAQNIALNLFVLFGSFFILANCHSTLLQQIIVITSGSLSQPNESQLFGILRFFFYLLNYHCTTSPTVFPTYIFQRL